MYEFDPNLPLEEASALPSQWYFDQQIYNSELNMFMNTWQLVGYKHMLQKPGDYITHEIAGESICVVLDENNELNAFYNVCRHRGAQILEGCGHASKLRCPYHGWTYDLKGNLRGTPEFDGVKNFCKEDNGLQKLKIAKFGPLIFVTHSRSNKTFEDLFESVNLPNYKFHDQLSYDIKCNWKVFVDNYLDGGYHVNYVHPDLAGVLDYKKYHTELHKFSNVQISPLQKDGSIDNVRSGDYAYYWWFFPNLMINIYENTFDTNLVIPTGVDSCKVLIGFFFAENTSKEWKNKSMEICDQIQQEDVLICENVQKGIQSRSYQTGRFSVRRESGDYHFHQLLFSELGNML